jgi:predicted extracellular nuclease
MRPTRLLVLLLSSIFALSAAPAQAQVVISQVFGGGGNTNAPFRSDFVELFNAGATPVDITGWSVQYASSTGTSWNATALSGTIPAGGYFLVKQADGAGTQPALPTPDAIGTAAMAGGNGKVALSNTTAALSGACPAAVDLVPYGTANCPNPTGGLGNTTAALRKGGGCTITGSATADFEVLTPAPRNSASTGSPCVPSTDPTNPAGTGGASPASVGAGNATLLTVTVVAGRNPDSTELAVRADLGAIGGSATQAFSDDGNNGDLAPGDGVFSFAATVAPATPTGAKALAFTIADGQGRSGSGQIALTVVPRVGIHDIQGAGRVSPLDGASVVTEGIVTAVKTNAFFLQTAPGEEDANPATSEGIVVFTGSAPPAAAAVGNRVAVAGRVDEFTPASNPNQLSLTEIVTPSVTLLSSFNTLPAPVLVTSAQANAASEVDTLERYEGMRVRFEDLVATSPVDVSVNEPEATSTPNFTFYAVIDGVARPFREPGIGALDVTPIPGGVTPPRFDTNPERIRVQGLGQVNGPVIVVDAHSRVSGLTGVLDYGFGAYTLLPDPDSPRQVTPGPGPRAVPAREQEEITVASYNMLRLYDDVDDPGSDVVLSTDAFFTRLFNAGRTICSYLGAPDILAVVEVENLNVLNRLAQAINQSGVMGCERWPEYKAYLQPGNDPGNINVGFLVRGDNVPVVNLPRVQVQEVVQLGKATVQTNPDGSTSLLNDRPPLLLRAVVNESGGASYPVTVVVNHLRSLNGVNSTAPGPNGWSTEGARVRAKRAAQARFLAEQIQARQVANPAEHLVVLGDFNAFEFNDGYADVMGIITGREAAASEVLNHVASPVTSPLTNLTLSLPPEDRYSYVFEGNAQALDHVLVNQALLDAVPRARIEHARINADFGLDTFGELASPVGGSDHDPVVLFLPLTSFGNANLETLIGGTSVVTRGKPVAWEVFVANNGPSVALDTLVSVNLDLELPGLALQVPDGLVCSTPVVGGGRTTFECATEAMPVRYTGRIGLTAQTTEAMTGRTVMVTSRIQAATPDDNPSDNDGFTFTEIAPPEAELSVLPNGAAPVVLEREATVDYAVRNGGRDPAEDVQVVFSVVGLASKLAADVPAGWTCGTAQYDGMTTSLACDLEGDFDTPRTDILSMRLRNDRTGPVVLTVRVSTPTGEFSKTNNSTSEIHMVLVRSTR